jgi:hypothetical protein
MKTGKTMKNREIQDFACPPFGTLKPGGKPFYESASHLALLSTLSLLETSELEGENCHDPPSTSQLQVSRDSPHWPPTWFYRSPSWT